MNTKKLFMIILLAIIIGFANFFVTKITSLQNIMGFYYAFLYPLFIGLSASLLGIFFFWIESIPNFGSFFRKIFLNPAKSFCFSFPFVVIILLFIRNIETMSFYYNLLYIFGTFYGSIYIYDKHRADITKFKFSNFFFNEESYGKKGSALVLKKINFHLLGDFIIFAGDYSILMLIIDSTLGTLFQDENYIFKIKSVIFAHNLQDNLLMLGIFISYLIAIYFIFGKIASIVNSNRHKRDY